MTEIRHTDGTVDPASVRLRALELVSNVWGDDIGHKETLDVAKEYAAWIESGAPLAAEVRTTADEMTRAVKRLVGERDDARAEAAGARADYEQLKGFNAELADERDRLRRELDQVRRAAKAAEAGRD